MARNVDSVDGDMNPESAENADGRPKPPAGTLYKYLLLGTKDKMSQCQNFCCKAAGKGCDENVCHIVDKSISGIAAHLQLEIRT